MHLVFVFTTHTFLFTDLFFFPPALCACFLAPLPPLLVSPSLSLSGGRPLRQVQRPAVQPQAPAERAAACGRQGRRHHTRQAGQHDLGGGLRPEFGVTDLPRCSVMCFVLCAICCAVCCAVCCVLVLCTVCCLLSAVCCVLCSLNRVLSFVLSFIFSALLFSSIYSSAPLSLCLFLYLSNTHTWRRVQTERPASGRRSASR